MRGLTTFETNIRQSDIHDTESYTVMQAWLVDGFSQRDIDHYILGEPVDSHGFECWKILNGQYGLTREFKFAMPWARTMKKRDDEVLNRHLKELEVNEDFRIQPNVREVLTTFWELYWNLREEAESRRSI